MTKQEVLDTLLDSFESDYAVRVAVSCSRIFLGLESPEMTLEEFAEFLADKFLHSRQGDDEYEFINLMLQNRFDAVEAMICRFLEYEQMNQIRRQAFGDLPDEIADQCMKAISCSISFQ